MLSMNCQNCHSLRFNAEALCTLVGIVESLQSVISNIQPVIDRIQPMLNAIQPVVNRCEPSSSSSDAIITPFGRGDSIVKGDIRGKHDADDAEDDAEDGAEDNTSNRDDSTRRCPHPECALKSRIYTQESSLIRHFNSREFIITSHSDAVP